MGTCAIVAATVLHGINLCFARLSQIKDILDNRQHIPKLFRNFDPTLTAICLLLLLIGIVRIIQSLSPESSQCESSGEEDDETSGR